MKEPAVRVEIHHTTRAALLLGEDSDLSCFKVELELV
jgi:hypothetical protein